MLRDYQFNTIGHFQINEHQINSNPNDIEN